MEFEPTKLSVGEKANQYENISNVSTEQGQGYMTRRVPYMSTYLAIDVYLVPIIGVLGLVGNVVSFIVLGRDRSMKKSARTLLRALAVADSLFLISCFFSQTLYTVNYNTNWVPTLRQHYPWIELITWPVSYTTQTIAVWMVVIVTADRYIAICKPFHAAQYSTTPRARKAVVCVWVFSTLYNLPRYFEYHVNIYIHIETNETVPVVDVTDLGKNRNYFLVYRMCCNFLFRFMVPFCALIFFNVRLAQAVRTSARTHRRQSGGQKLVRSNTLMLIVVVVVFLLCEMPCYLRRVCEVLAEFHLVEFPNESLNIYAVYFTNLLLMVNSAVNFLIYLVLGQRFRTILRAMFCGKATRDVRLNDLQHRTTVTTKL